MLTALKERGIQLTPEFEDAAKRMGNDALKWTLQFVQWPLPPEKTPGWDDLRFELILLMVFWKYGSPKVVVEGPSWEEISLAKDFRRRYTEDGELYWEKIHLPPAKEVKEIHATIGAWLHDFMKTGFVPISISNISEISFAISKNKNTPRNSRGQSRRIWIVAVCELSGGVCVISVI